MAGTSLAFFCMFVRHLVVCAALGSAALLMACGAGSGRFTGTDVQVSGIGPSAPLNGGDPIVFTMTVTNAGDFDAEELQIRNATSQVSPASVRISCTASGGAVCPETTGSSMDVSKLPSNGVLVFNITGTLNAGASGAVEVIQKPEIVPQMTCAAANELALRTKRKAIPVDVA